MGMVLPVGARGLIAPGMPQVLNPAHFSVPNGLVGYWGFDPDCLDFTNNLAFDLSGNNNKGILVGGPSLFDGKIGQALNFNGADGAAGSYVDLGNPSILQISGALTISVWVVPSSISRVAGIIGKTFRNEYDLYMYSDNRLILSQGDGSTEQDCNFGSYFTAANIWYHIVIVRDIVVNKVTAYKNGQTFSNPQSYTITPTASSTNAFIGAAGYNTSSNRWAGLIDDLRIYNRALDPWEITTLYKSGLAGRRDAGALLPQECELDMMPSVIDFRRSLSTLGTRAGSRQRMAG